MSVRKDGESSSKAIDRLMDQVDAAHTGRDILRGLTGIPELSYEDARAMLAIVAEDRENEFWDQNDLR